MFKLNAVYNNSLNKKNTFEVVKGIFTVPCIKTSCIGKQPQFGRNWRCREEKHLVSFSCGRLVAMTSTRFCYGQEATVLNLSQQLCVAESSNTGGTNPSVCMRVYMKAVVCGRT